MPSHDRLTLLAAMYVACIIAGDSDYQGKMCVFGCACVFMCEVLSIVPLAACNGELLICKVEVAAM